MQTGLAPFALYFTARETWVYTLLYPREWSEVRVKGFSIVRLERGGNVSNTRRTIPANELDSMPPDLRTFMHSRADGVVCGSCGIQVTPKHKLHDCPECRVPFGAIYVEHGASDIQLHGRPTYYVERAAEVEQGYAS